MLLVNIILMKFMPPKKKGERFLPPPIALQPRDGKRALMVNGFSNADAGILAYINFVEHLF